MPQQKLTPNEIKLLHDALSADYKNSSIRLREGEYQYGLAKAIASFQLELYFPDVRDIIRRMYGETKINDIQLIRKTQTVLKKMYHRSVVVILQKKKPWELQRYALAAFKFQDAEKNMIVFATEQEIKQSQNLLSSAPRAPMSRVKLNGILMLTLASIIALSYAVIIWTMIQPIINPFFFIPAFSVAVTCSLILGRTLARG